MSLSNAAETAVLEQVFLGTALPWNANTDLWIALYSADPGEAGTAPTNEIVTGDWDTYARKAVTRATDLAVAGNVVSNVNLEQFVASGGGSGTVITHAGLVTTASGAGTLIASHILNNPITVGVGTQPQFAPGAFAFDIN